jgi:hypothetical protein
VKHGREIPPFDGDRFEFTGLDQLGEPLPSGPLRKSVVVNDVGGGGHTEASGRPTQKLAMGLLLRWGRNSPDLIGHDPFHQVELLHEPRTTTDPDLTDPKQPVECERTLGAVAPPRTVSRTRVDELSRGKRTLPNLVEYLVEVPRVGGGELDKPFHVCPAAARCFCHRMSGSSSTGISEAS